jgi:hypothetical protein
LPKPFEIRAATHRCQARSYALIYAVPHPDGFCVFAHGDAYQDGTKQVIVFKAGDVFGRHGTRSEGWNQGDIASIKRRLDPDADSGRGQQAEARSLLHAVDNRLGGSGLWLAVAVVPEYLLPMPR